MFALVRDNKITSDAYIETMFRLVKDLPIVLVETDLGYGIQSVRFRDELEGHFVEAGIAESNAIGIAAGLSANGFIPVAHSLAPFITRRCYDQLVLSIAYSGLNIKILGQGPGLYSELNGGTHFSIEDAGIIRNIPRFKIVDCADNVAIEKLLPQVMADPEPTYIRIARGAPYKVYEKDASFTVGKANVLREGTDATIMANSVMLAFSLAAAEMLEKEGISVRVLDMHTIKPIDREAVLAAAKIGPIITVENHSVINGIGSAVAEVLAEEGCGVRLTRLGLQDEFGVVGFMDTIAEELHLRPEDIAADVKKALGK
jgi:transketolase